MDFLQKSRDVCSHERVSFRFAAPLIQQLLPGYSIRAGAPFISGKAARWLLGCDPPKKNVSTIYSCFISNASSWGDVFLGPGASSDVVINGSATTKGGFKACRSTLGLGVNYVFVLSLC